jgi:hypothetical protein
MALSDAAPFAVAHWTMDEASGNRADSVGSNTLVDNNTVTSAAGKFSNAAEFTLANSEYLSCADNAALSSGDVKYMVRCWVKFKTKATTQVITAKREALEHILDYHAGSDRLRFLFGDAGITAAANNFGDVSVDTWHLIHAWHDSDADVIGISVNAGTANTISDVGANPVDGNGAFNVGRDPAFNANFLDGFVDDLVVLKGYVLDATERTADYNGGTGVAFADWDAGGGGAKAPPPRRRPYRFFRQGG